MTKVYETYDNCVILYLSGICLVVLIGYQPSDWNRNKRVSIKRQPGTLSHDQRLKYYVDT